MGLVVYIFLVDIFKKRNTKVQSITKYDPVTTLLGPSEGPLELIFSIQFQFPLAIHLCSSYYMPDTKVNINFIIITTLWGRYCPCFTKQRMNEAQSGGGGVVGVMILPKDKDVVSAKYSGWNSDLILGPYCESTTLCSSYIPLFRSWQFISEPVLVCLPNSPTIYPECCLLYPSQSWSAAEVLTNWRTWRAFLLCIYQR